MLSMKRKLKIAFVGFNSSCPLQERVIYRLLAERYDLELSSAPEYVIVQGTDHFEHWKFSSAVKIQLMGENAVPDFNAFDYAVGFHHLSFGDRYLRCPLFALYRDYRSLVERTAVMSDEQLVRRAFCSFVVSNSAYADPLRREFFERLSKYRPVASGGRWLNNIGGPVKDKLAFCRGYKFNLAFENSAVEGYTTEKIMEAYAAETVPIYFGNPTVETDFRRESMVVVADKSDVERAIDEVMALDQDDRAYLAKCRERPFAETNPLIYEERLVNFLASIFAREPKSALRRAEYGYQAMSSAHQARIAALDHGLSNMVSAVKRIFRR